MSNSIKIFENNQFGQIRSIEKDGEPWFVAKDICDALAHSDVSMACSKLMGDEKGTSIVCTPGGKQKMTVISESGLYSLIFTSRLEKAQEFRHWVTSEVLPSIRKTGSYTVTAPDAIDYKKLPSTNHAASILMRSYKMAGANMVSLASTIAAMYRGLGVPVPSLEAPVQSVYLSASQIADKLGIMSKSGKPHAQLVSGIIDQIDVPEELTQIMTFEQNGHSGTMIQYKPEVMILVEKYLYDSDFPLMFNLRDRNYQVQYRR